MPDTTSHSPLEKRIKRQVIARRMVYFANGTPGFEPLLLDEIASLPVLTGEMALTSGGVEFTGRLQACYLGNLMLRTANRVLMRLTAFKAENFRKLQKKLLDFPWELFVPAAGVPEVKVTTKHSRLYHSEAVGSHVVDAVRHRLSLKASPPGDKERGLSPGIFVRAEEDRFTLSLDSSGELLHKRGIKTRRARAPIRETAAAAALMLAGYDGSQILIDPLCGSGTFSIEAALIVRNIPPGWLRNFAFMTWPAFQPRSWAYIKRQVEQDFRPPPGRPLIFASDIDPKTCHAVEKTLQRANLSDTVRVARKDFFDFFPPVTPEGPGIVTINPPYGRRIGSRKESDRLFFEICRKLEKDYRGWRIALIVPRRHLLGKTPFPLDHRSFQHGGLSLTLATGIIP